MANIKDKETLTPEKPAEKKAVAKTTQKKPAIKTDANLNFPALFEMAMTNEKGLEIIKELTALKNQEEDRRAKKEFDLHFSEMQKDFLPAEKTKEVKNREGTKTLYKYCPLEDILKVYAPIMAKHGFTYSWHVEQKESSLDVTCTISAYGFAKSNTVNIPIMAGTAFTNDIQQRGSAISYGKRYSFINAVGVIIGGEDSDGNLDFDDGMKYGDMALQFDECQTVEEAHAKAQVFYKELKGTDAHGVEVVRKLYAQRKKELS